MPKHVSIMEIFLVFGSDISSSAGRKFWVGVSSADVRVLDPLQKAGLSWPYTSGATDTRLFRRKHGVVRRGVAIPNGLVAPDRRRLQRLRLTRCIRIAILKFHLTGGAVHGIEHW